VSNRKRNWFITLVLHCQMKHSLWMQVVL